MSAAVSEWVEGEAWYMGAKSRKLSLHRGDLEVLSVSRCSQTKGQLIYDKVLLLRADKESVWAQTMLNIPQDFLIILHVMSSPTRSTLCFFNGKKIWLRNRMSTTEFWGICVCVCAHTAWHEPLTESGCLIFMGKNIKLDIDCQMVHLMWSMIKVISTVSCAVCIIFYVQSWVKFLDVQAGLDAGLCVQ